MPKHHEKHTVVIVAEDDPDDRLLIGDAFRDASSKPVDVRFVNDGTELIDYLHRRGKYSGQESTPLPELVLLDLNMPRKTGLEALQEIKADQALRTIPVVVLTTSSDEEQIARSYELGGNGFITKPNSYSQLVEILRSLDRYWFQTVELP